MESIAVSKLRDNLMNVLKKIESGSEVVITSHGKAVAKLIPPDNKVKDAKKRLKEISKTAKIIDITSPIDTIW